VFLQIEHNVVVLDGVVRFEWERRLVPEPRTVQQGRDVRHLRDMAAVPGDDGDGDERS